MLIAFCVLCVLTPAWALVAGRAISGLYRELLASERAAAEARQVAATCAAADAELRRQAEHWRKAAERTKTRYLDTYRQLGEACNALKALSAPEKTDGDPI